MPMWATLAIGTGLSLFGAKKQADTSKDAAAQQVAAANAAKAELRPIYDDSLARMEPYRQLGGQALGQLGALSGFPALSNPTGGPVAIPYARTPITQEQMNNMPLPMMKPATPADMGGSQTLGSLAAGLNPGSTGGGVSSYGGPAQAQGGLIKMRAPDGEERDVPEAMASRLEQAGARRIG